MSGETKVTTNHEEIRRWASDRGGRPVMLQHDLANPRAAELQIDLLFHKYDDRKKEVSWDDFFARFEGDQLALVYQTETEGGKLSRFARIVRREAVPQAVIE